jgi:hypothetical protein
VIVTERVVNGGVMDFFETFETSHSMSFDQSINFSGQVFNSILIVVLKFEGII